MTERGRELGQGTGTRTPATLDARFSYDWRGWGQSMATKLSQLMTSEEMFRQGDISLVSCDGQLVPGHMVFLCAASDYFKGLIKKHYMQLGCLPAEIVFKYHTGQDLRNLLHFIYFGSIELPPPEMVRFLEMASQLKLDYVGEVSQPTFAQPSEPEKTTPPAPVPLFPISDPSSEPIEVSLVSDDENFLLEDSNGDIFGVDEVVEVLDELTPGASTSPAAAILPSDSQKTNLGQEQPQPSTSAEMIAGKKVGRSGGNQNEQFHQESTAMQDLMGKPPGTADAGEFNIMEFIGRNECSTNRPMRKSLKKNKGSTNKGNPGKNRTSRIFSVKVPKKPPSYVNPSTSTAAQSLRIRKSVDFEITPNGVVTTTTHEEQSPAKKKILRSKRHPRDKIRQGKTTLHLCTDSETLGPKIRIRDDICSSPIPPTAGRRKSPRLQKEARGSVTIPPPSPIEEIEANSQDDPLQDDDDDVIHITTLNTTDAVEIITLDDEETSSNDAIPKTIAPLPKTKMARKRTFLRRKPSKTTNVDRRIKTPNITPMLLRITSEGQLVSTKPAYKITGISQDSKGTFKRRKLDKWTTYEGICNICRTFGTTHNKCSGCGHLICHKSSCRQDYVRFSCLINSRKEILCVICK